MKILNTYKILPLINRFLTDLKMRIVEASGRPIVKFDREDEREFHCFKFERVKFGKNLLYEFP